MLAYSYYTMYKNAEQSRVAYAYSTNLYWKKKLQETKTKA